MIQLTDSPLQKHVFILSVQGRFQYFRGRCSGPNIGVAPNVLFIKYPPQKKYKSNNFFKVKAGHSRMSHYSFLISYLYIILSPYFLSGNLGVGQAPPPPSSSAPVIVSILQSRQF